MVLLGGGGDGRQHHHKLALRSSGDYCVITDLDTVSNHELIGLRVAAAGVDRAQTDTPPAADSPTVLRAVLDHQAPPHCSCQPVTHVIVSASLLALHTLILVASIMIALPSAGVAHPSAGGLAQQSVVARQQPQAVSIVLAASSEADWSQHLLKLNSMKLNQPECL